jgi:hypothetical protein
LLGVARTTSPWVVMWGKHKIGVDKGTYHLVEDMTGSQDLLLYRIGHEPFDPSRSQPSHYPSVVKPTREGREGEKGIWFSGGRAKLRGGRGGWEGSVAMGMSPMFTSFPLGAICTNTWLIVGASLAPEPGEAEGGEAALAAFFGVLDLVRRFFGTFQKDP